MLVSHDRSQLHQEISVQTSRRMSFWPYALELTRELRWLWPSGSCTGLGLSSVVLVGILCCGAGLCLGIGLTLLVDSNTCRRVVQHAVWALVSNTAPLQAPNAGQALRRRLGEYRNSA